MYSAPDIYRCTVYIPIGQFYFMLCLNNGTFFKKLLFSFPTENKRGPWASVVT